MKKYLSVLVLMAFPVFAILMMLALRMTQVQASEQPTANEIMEGIDRVRNPGQPYRVVMALTEYINSKPRDRDVLVLYVKQDEQSRQLNNLESKANVMRVAGSIRRGSTLRSWYGASCRRRKRFSAAIAFLRRIAPVF